MRNLRAFTIDRNLHARLSRGALLLMLASLPVLALAQPQEVAKDGFVLRSSTVSSERIAESTAREHGINPSPTRGVLNVVVLKPDTPTEKTVPARVTASTTNLAGLRSDIDMREVKAGGRVSYLGTYEFLPKEVITFEVKAVPAGGPPLSLEYQERMWAR